ncbi:MAG: hypothetical protein LBL33_05680 [Tannerella sp.]|jgi:hypothetical protein|nr:hypothetical protein [Tannerella sp.]
MKIIKKITFQLQRVFKKLERIAFPVLEENVETTMLVQSELLKRSLLNNPKYLEPNRLELHGFKVYSQNDEDGIIQEIFKRIGTTSKIFIEFGIGNGMETNTLYLLMQGWKGYWIDGNPTFVSHTKKVFKRAIDRGQLFVEESFITKDNIDSLLGKYFTGEIDLLSIDIDGNDYYVWENIKCINPRVVIVEYNAKFPPPCSFIMEYNETHHWDESDKMGMSLQAATDLGDSLGYQLVGTNLNGVNAFFVRKDIIRGKESALFPLPATAENLYNPAHYYLPFRGGHPARHFLG